MSSESPDDEWELSKENVQPLRQGRRLSSLNAGLKQGGGFEDHRIKEEKHAFEAELRSYTGDDPIEVWYGYILWAEQTFPKGGPESNLTTLLERCAREFNNVDKYRNDERYIYVWMKMADICNDPLEIYNFMFDQNIGCELSCFYEGWACLLEQLGNHKKADAVYQSGLRKNARPYEKLKSKHENFQMRLTRRVVNGESFTDTAGSQEPEGQHRQVLSQLRTMGKKRQVPVNRAGASIQGGAGVLSGARPKTKSNAGIQIYHDENQEVGSLPAQTGEWTTAPKREVTNKENEQKAGIWRKQKMKSKINVPISEVNTYNQLPFTVHVDEDNAQQSLRTPAKMPELGNQVLRKEDKTSTSSYLATLTTSQENKNERVMYCKDKVYCGTEEFSLEELRAISWFKLQEKHRQEKEAKEIQDKWRRLEEERQQLLDETERVRQQRLQIQEEEKALLVEARRKRQQFEQQLQRDREQDEHAVNESIHARLQEQQARSESLTSTVTHQSARQLMFDDGSHGNTENIPPHITVDAASRSLNSSSRTPPSFNNTMQKLAESFEKNMSGMSSPTVNMKEAMLLVRGMFNGSLDLDKSAQSADVHMSEQPSQPPSSGAGLPFQIFDESQKQPAQHRNISTPVNQNTSAVRQNTGSAAPFTVFQDSTVNQNTSAVRQKNSSSAPFPVFQDYTVNQAPAVNQNTSSVRPNIAASIPFPVFQDSAVNSNTSAVRQKTSPLAVFQDNDSVRQNTASSAPVSAMQNRDSSSTLNQSQNVSVRRRKTSGPQSNQSGEQLPVFTADNNRRTTSVAHPLFEDDGEGIQSHARDDITMAPIGSNFSFAASARFASTPFNPNSSGSGARKSPDLDVSDVEMPGIDGPANMSGIGAPEDHANMSGVEFEAPVPAGTSAGTENKLQPDNQDQTVENVSSNSFRKNLSPIMEGSSEDSGAHSKHPLHHTTMESLSGLGKKQLTPVQDITENTSMLGKSRSMLGDNDIADDDDDDDDYNQPTNVIDMSSYVPPDNDEKTEQLLSMSICIENNKDPFDLEARDAMVAALSPPLCHHDNYTSRDEPMPQVRAGSILSLGFQVYEVKEKIGEGGYAKIFLVESGDDMFGGTTGTALEDKYQVIKVEKPAQQWEYYICAELYRRLTKLHDIVDVRPAIMEISNGFFFQDGSILVSSYKPNGTLLDLVNKAFKSHSVALPNLEPVMVYMTIELLHLIENIHKCHIIHGDIKPDNFLVLQFPNLPESTDPQVVFAGGSRFIQLIDFGQSIDMSKYPPGTTFLSKVNTQCFQCIEMKTNRPWTYQTDLFGLAGTLHVLIYGHYMKVYQEADVWKTSSTIYRTWDRDLWKKLFHALLNVPSCTELPDLAEIRHEFEDYFVKNLLLKYNKMCRNFNKTVCSNS